MSDTDADLEGLLRKRDAVNRAIKAHYAIQWLEAYGDIGVHQIDVHLSASAVQGHSDAKEYVMRAARAALPAIISSALKEALEHWSEGTEP